MNKLVTYNERERERDSNIVMRYKSNTYKPLYSLKCERDIIKILLNKEEL